MYYVALGAVLFPPALLLGSQAWSQAGALIILLRKDCWKDETAGIASIPQSVPSDRTEVDREA